MPFGTGGGGIHDDGYHTGNAKRNAVSGVKGIDAAQNLTPKAVMADIDAAILNVANGIAGLDASILLALTQQRLNFAVGTFTRNMTAISENVSYTGVGFVPRLVLFFALIGGTSVINFIGIITASSNISLRDDAITLAGTYGNSESFCLYLAPAAGATQTAAYNGFGADGFTLTWTKTGAPTGIVNIYYIAVR